MQQKKTAVITGGSQGLGLEIAIALADLGYTTVLLARTESKLATAVAAIHERGGTAYSFAVDVSDSAALAAVVEQIAGQFAQIDFLVVNAGVVHVEQLQMLKIEQIHQDIAVDLWGAIATCKLSLPLLTNSSKILLVSSGFGLMGAAGYATYCAAKAGMINFGEALRRELAWRKVSVYVAVPGDIDTMAFRAERASMPAAWMSRVNARGQVMTPTIAATKILRQCRGRRFLIVINFEVRLFLLLSKILPRRLRDYLVDKMLPCPDGQTQGPSHER